MVPRGIGLPILGLAATLNVELHGKRSGRAIIFSEMPIGSGHCWLSAAQISAQHRRATGSSRRRPCPFLLSAQSFHQSFAGHYFARRHGVRALVPHGVVAQPARNAAALPGSRGSWIARTVGALRAPALQMESGRARPARLRSQYSGAALHAYHRPAARGRAVGAAEKLWADPV